MSDLLKTVPSVNLRRVHTAAGAAATFASDQFPVGFPTILWQEQSTRYLSYWEWFDGTKLSEIKGKTSNNEPVYRFPLAMNSVRNFSRKHATLLMGEDTQDSPAPLVRTLASPKAPLDGGKFSEEDQALAQLCQNAVNEVWYSSGGRSLQMENATLQQFLGGCVFRVSYLDPSDPRTWARMLPVTIENVIPDFFLPIWRNGDYWNLLECYVAYRIPAKQAAAQYGIDEQLSANSGWIVYVEHWKADSYSVYLDGVPLKRVVNGVEIVYHNLENPFGIVPFVYIPHLREGDFYGPSIVPDIEGLILEYNARMSDNGDAIRKTVHRQRYAVDINNPSPIQLAPGVDAINLGSTNIATKATPQVDTEDPPEMNQTMTEFSDDLWQQLSREGSMNDISFGEDKVGQRSALAIALKMLPSTSHARAERTFWTDGLNLLSMIVLRVLAVKKIKVGGKLIPEDFAKRLNFVQDFLPMIPRDREQLVNEVVLRLQAGALAPEKALEMLGDTRNIDEHMALIKAWMTFKAGLEAMGTAKDKGAPQSIVKPMATSGVEDKA